MYFFYNRNNFLEIIITYHTCNNNIIWITTNNIMNIIGIIFHINLFILPKRSYQRLLLSILLIVIKLGLYNYKKIVVSKLLISRDCLWMKFVIKGSKLVSEIIYFIESSSVFSIKCLMI